jgi:energy-converting hydrogenase Eha subunit H
MRARFAIAPWRRMTAFGPRVPLGPILRTLALILIAVFVAVEAFLLLGGYRVLVDEERVRIGQHRVIEGWGDLADRKQASLVCSYFTGLRVEPHVFDFSRNGMLGRDDCPLILAD